MSHHAQLFSLSRTAGPLIVRQSRAMASVRKPVIVRKFSRDWCAGYAAAQLSARMRRNWRSSTWPARCCASPGSRSSGSATSATSLPGDDQANPERLLHKRFAIRPRTAGLWLRMTLTDGEELEGLAANDRSLIEGAGLLLTPPDTRSNTQRIYRPPPGDPDAGGGKPDRRG